MKGKAEDSHMKDGIIKRGNSYTTVVYLGRDENGKKHQKWITAPTKREVQAMRTEILHQLHNGTFATPRGTVAEFMERWLNEYAKSLAPRTYEGYQSIYQSGIKPAMGDVLLKDLRPDRIQKYYTDKLAAGDSPTTVRHHHFMIHGALDYAVKLQLLPRNPADAATAPPLQHAEMHTLDEDSTADVLDAFMDTPYFTLFHTSLYTGLRRSEVLALRWQDIDLIGAEISVSRAMHQLRNKDIIFRTTKTARSARKVSLAPETCEVLRKHLENEMALCARVNLPFANDRLVFCTWDGKALLPGTITQAWRRLVTKLGYHVRLHDARHTHASLLLKAGIHPKVVQERLGHATISTTLDLYSHVAPGMQKQAAEAFGALLNPRISKGLANRSYVNNGKGQKPRI